MTRKTVERTSSQICWPTRKWSSCISIILFMTSVRITTVNAHFFRECMTSIDDGIKDRNQVTTILIGTDGKCPNCEPLANCTTVRGSLVVRQRFGRPQGGSDPYFPFLTEITGYLIIFYLQSKIDLFSFFPNLAVIRGQTLFSNYAFVVHNSKLETIDLRALTVIKRGGIRIQKNNNLCYAKTVRWKSILLEKALDQNNYGIVFSKNNENCYDKCFKGQCSAPPGHGLSGSQYCWGPGRPQDYECQYLCNSICGSHGCIKEKGRDICCHQQCLGGCSRADSPNSCFACQNYRLKDGKCVDKCPSGKLIVDDYKCEDKCPAKVAPFVHLGACVLKCPAGYTNDAFTCKKCKANRCPRVCNITSGTVVIKALSDIRKSGLAGCTEVIGNLKIELRIGAANIVKELEDSLGSIGTVRGYVEVRESAPLVSLDFFKSLTSIQPDKLSQDRYAFVVLNNNNLESLWKPKEDFNISKGKLFIHLNPKLCKQVIREFVGNNASNRFSISEDAIGMNGHAADCGNIKKINITVKEEKSILVKIGNAVIRLGRCDIGKCVEVSWLHERNLDDRNLFYTVNYKIVENKTNADETSSVCGEPLWNRVDVPVKIINVTSGNVKLVVPMKKLLKGLKAHKQYAFYVQTFVLKGEGRKSNVVYLRTSEDKPSIPLGLEASHLSATQIQLKWNPPDEPNGIMTGYKIYYRKSTYLFWKNDIDWCKRDLDSAVVTEKENENNNVNTTVGINGSCPKNFTCQCEKKKQEEKRIKADRNAVLLEKEFEDRLLKEIFVKPKENNKRKDKVRLRRPRKPSGNRSGTQTGNGCSGNDLKAPCSTTRPTATSSETRPPTATIQKTRISTKISSPSIIKTSTKKSKLYLTTKSPEKVIPVLHKRYVSGNELSFEMDGLEHFQDYSIWVCGCTQAGCAELSTYMATCAFTNGRTDVNKIADNLPGTIMVSVNKDLFSYNVSWTAPPDPNGIVLKYLIAVRLKNNEEIVHCRPGNSPTYFEESGVAAGNYSVRVRAVTPAINGSWSNITYFSIGSSSVLARKDDKSAIIGIGATAGIIIALLAILVVYYAYVKKTTETGVPGVLYASVNPEYLNSNEVYIPDEWEVPRENIEICKDIGKGSFGMVYEGIAYGLVSGEPKLRVAVKTVNENASIRDRIEFLQEASIMKAFNCNHIVKLLGVVSQGQPTLVVMELMERGDLKSFLRSRRPEEKGGLLPPSLAEILQMAAEIADGMAYLAGRKFVHRDLAARNCMVAANFTVKIGDFGMTRDIYETDYYRKGGKGLLPVRWMAPESLKDGIFTTASDVWSYGVVLWEMATLAAQPYPGKSNEEVLRFVIDGGILERPDDCAERLYNLMTICWKADPRARPSFLEVVNFLENDVSEDFEECSFYHELKRKLMDATETNLLKGPEHARDSRRGSFPAPSKGEPPSETESEENWKTEADRSINPGADDNCASRSKSIYDNDGSAENMRYVDINPGARASPRIPADGSSIPSDEILRVDNDNVRVEPNRELRTPTNRASRVSFGSAVNYPMEKF